MAKHFGNTQQIENLLAAIQAGDEEAREDLIKESQERLRRLASKMLKGFPGVARVAGQTEDVLQPVLFRLYGALEKKKFDSGREFVSYAAQTIRHELLDLARKYRREFELRRTNRPDVDSDAPLAHLAKEHAPVGVLAEVEKWERLQEAVEQLPEEERTVIDLRCYGHRSRQETAVLLDIDEKTVTRRYGRALEKLGKALQDVFGDEGR